MNDLLHGAKEMCELSAVLSSEHRSEVPRARFDRRARVAILLLTSTAAVLGLDCPTTLASTDFGSCRKTVEAAARKLIEPLFGEDETVTIRFDDVATKLLGIECVEVHQVRPGGVDKEGNVVISTTRHTMTVALNECSSQVFKLRGFGIPTEFNAAVAGRSTITTEREAAHRAEAYLRLTTELEPFALPASEEFWEVAETFFIWDPRTHVRELRNYYRTWSPTIEKYRLRRFEKKEGDGFRVLTLIGRAESHSIDDRQLIASAVLLSVQPDGSVTVIEDNPFLVVSSSRSRKGISTTVR